MGRVSSIFVGLGTRSRVALAGAAVMAIVTLAVGAVLLSSAYLARQIVSDSIVLDEAERTLAANDLLVKALNQAVLLGEDELLGVAGSETAEVAVEEARRTATELELRGDELLRVLGDQAGDIGVLLSTASSTAAGVLGALDAGEVVRSGDLLLDGMVAFEDLRNEVNAVRSGARSNVEASEGLVGRTGSLVAFLIAMLIPIAAILGYRQIAAQQVRVAEVELDARIHAEQEISRSKDEFIGNVSHELRTPLTSIYGFSQLLLDQGLVDPESAMELIGLINGEASELSRMIEDILVVARSEGGSLTYKMGEHDLRAELEGSVAALGEAGIEGELTGPTASVWIDPIRFRHIIRNLVSNAERHGGPRITISWEQRGGNVEVVVADDGPGVAAADEKRLFAPFFHEGESPLTTGTLGMGLAAVQALAAGMHGCVRYARMGGWSRFTVTIPAAPAASHEDETPVARRPGRAATSSVALE